MKTTHPPARRRSAPLASTQDTLSGSACEPPRAPAGPVARRGSRRWARALLVLAAAWCLPGGAHSQPATDDAAGEAQPGEAQPDEARPHEAQPRSPAGAEHDDKLRELEERVITLKERVFRAKTRLLLLKERILNDVIAESKVVIFHEDDMGGSLKPTQVLYHLDGEKIYFQDESSGVLDDQPSIEIFNQNVAPGNHVLAVEMIYQGDSALFAYLDDYVFKLRANYTFYATKGKITTVRAIGHLRGDVTYDLRERPSIKFDVKQVSYTTDADGARPDVLDSDVDASE